MKTRKKGKTATDSGGQNSAAEREVSASSSSGGAKFYVVWNADGKVEWFSDPDAAFAYLKAHDGSDFEAFEDAASALAAKKAREQRKTIMMSPEQKVRTFWQELFCKKYVCSNLVT
jgi:hypothetical protein